MVRRKLLKFRHCEECNDEAIQLRKWQILKIKHLKILWIVAPFQGSQ
jgi:hypothetical protein